MKCVCQPCKNHGWPIDREHTKTRGSGGSDSRENVSLMCRVHHTEKGMKGISYMAQTYPSYKKWLIDNGWQFDEFRKKWVNYGVNKFIVKGQVRNG